MSKRFYTLAEILIILFMVEFYGWSAAIVMISFGIICVVDYSEFS